MIKVSGSNVSQIVLPAGNPASTIRSCLNKIFTISIGQFFQSRVSAWNFPMNPYGSLPQKFFELGKSGVERIYRPGKLEHLSAARLRIAG
jgi:hypothetical protein